MRTSAITTIIVIHSPQPWARANRRWAFRALADTLPEHAGILVVDRPVDVVTTPWRDSRRARHGLWSTRIEQENEQLAIVRPRLPLHELLAARLPGVTRLNTRLLSRQLRRALTLVYPHAQQIIQWLHNAEQAWMYEAIDGCGRVYHCYDEYNYDSDGTFLPRRWEIEQTVLTSADVTFVTSSLLIPRRADLARRLELLPNGMPEFFLDSNVDDDDEIAAIPGPRLGYVGNIFPLIDFAMLANMMTRRPDWHLVMVGPVHRTADVSPLRTLPNVHFVGSRPHEHLPSVMQYFDVGLIPIIINGFTKPLTPLKLFEYMACGVPVVSTKFPELEQYASDMELVDCTGGAFEQAVIRTLQQDREQSAARLRKIAHTRTWTAINREYVVPVLRDVFSF